MKSHYTVTCAVQLIPIHVSSVERETYFAGPIKQKVLRYPKTITPNINLLVLITSSSSSHLFRHLTAQNPVTTGLPTVHAWELHILSLSKNCGNILSFWPRFSLYLASRSSNKETSMVTVMAITPTLVHGFACVLSDVAPPRCKLHFHQSGNTVCLIC
jgi:hypothetical protein